MQLNKCTLMEIKSIQLPHFDFLRKVMKHYFRKLPIKIKMRFHKQF